MNLYKNFLNLQKKTKEFLRWRTVPKNNITNNIETNKPIEYLNDPTTPNLVKSIDPNTLIFSNFIVKGYKGGGFKKESIEGQAANCCVTISNTIVFFNKKSEKQIPPWPGTSNLHILPHAGVNLNAFYDRRSLQFFYINDRRFGDPIFTCDSAEIVAHELGHAILDAYRPETWSAMSLEVASFHEAFADFTAIMHSLTYDEIIDYILNETQGNLNKENIASELAEQFGRLIYRISPESGKKSNALRSATNNFKYVNPGTLPQDAPRDQLAAECHSFGRIFLGALYDILIIIYEENIREGKEKKDSLKEARDTLTKYVLKSIQNAPLNSKFYNSMAKTLLWADVVLNNRKYHDKMQKIFFERNLISNQLMMLNAPTCDNNDLIIKNLKIDNIKLNDFVLNIQSNENPLYNVELEIPKQSAYLYDVNKNIYDIIPTSDEEGLSGAIDMINYLHNTKSISNDSSAPFEIKNNKLTRNYYS